MLVDYKAASVLGIELALALEKQIIFGDLPGGMHLTEEVVSKTAGVSRSPVREAMRVLEQSGLVVREPRRGVRIPLLTAEEMDDLYTCRLPLERLVAELATKNATLSDIAEIQARQEACENLFKMGNIRAHFEANLEMSAALLRATHSPTLIRTVSSLTKHAARYRFQIYDTRRFREYSVMGGAQLVQLLKQRDIEGAVKATERMLLTAWPIIRQRLSKLQETVNGDAATEHLIRLS
ncbi:GntR family transcriptional regulator [Rhizobium gallicum]|uniref:GntR family transcriptional regulator n=1 Tax=Rhizobium gallicum TaxID=56730 RepID=UPI001EF91DC9|nr:GntR family transcriptional regulator [Rhizobium gallicum]ULJ74254.1 GntR family transcriptional regulator [Rhizobium gallicum]